MYKFRLLDFGQETVVLSGLNKQAGESLKHIKNLYDETKYLKSYLEQVSVYHTVDYIIQRKCTSQKTIQNSKFAASSKLSG